MTTHKRGKELAQEMREEEPTRPAAQQCSCGEWRSAPHARCVEPKPDDDQSQGGGR